MAHSRGARLALLGLAALLLAPPAATQEEAQTETESQAEARALLLRTLETIEAAKRLSFEMDEAFDVVQDSGETLEFGLVRRVTLRRPDRLRIHSQQRHGEEAIFVYDGETGTIYSPDQKTYARAALGSTVDEAMDRMVAEIGVPVPVSELLESDVPSRLSSREDPLLVGPSQVGGVECDHLAFRTPTVDAQFWIARQEPRLPRRVVLTYHLEEGTPQFRADFSERSLDAEAPDSLFVLDLPEGARQVNFVQLRTPDELEKR